MRVNVNGTLAFSTKITVPTGLGNLDFMAWAGSTTDNADTVSWFGGATKHIEGNASILATVEAAAVGRKGLVFYVS